MNKNIFIVLIVALILVGAGVGYYLAKGAQPEKGSPDPAQVQKIFNDLKPE